MSGIKVLCLLNIIFGIVNIGILLALKKPVAGWIFAVLGWCVAFLNV